MKTDKELRDYVLAHPGLTAAKIAQNLNNHADVNVARVRAAIEAIKGGGEPPQPSTPKKPLAGLIVEFDDVGKVRKAVKELSGSEYLDDEDLRRSLRISEFRWRQVRNQPELGSYLYTLPNGRKVWMTPGAQAKLKQAIELATT